LFAAIGTSFGEGDGSTTFNVPDLRGEFIRGAGTNHHTGQGNGAAPGYHQDATTIPYTYANNGANNVNFAGDGTTQNIDSIPATTSYYQTINSGAHGASAAYNFGTVRPTNTSVNFFIKATNVAVPADFINSVNSIYGPLIPSNASASNKLVAKSDTAIKHNYSMVGTASLEDDIKTFVTALLALGTNTYVGFFNRSGNLGTAGNYSITVYAEEGTSTFASGYIVLGAGAMGKAQYEVSYYKPTGSSVEWTIKKLVTESENNFKYQVITTDSDLNNVTASGTYSVYISDPTSQATNHAPTYGWLQLIVIQMNNSQTFCNQILYSADGKMFMRECGNTAWSAWKQVAVNTIQSGTITIPAQTLANGAAAEIEIPLALNEFYCGRIDFANLPSANMSLSYNDFSGTFQDTRSTENRTQYVLYPIGKANLATLHVYLTNYTGSPVTISDIPVTYYLEHHAS
jgi:microcystin-dependent protein